MGILKEINFLFGVGVFLLWLFSILAVYYTSLREDNGIKKFIKNKGFLLVAIVSLVAMAGSLYYSEIARFDPCRLCWFQRILIYPLGIIFLVEYLRKNFSIIYSGIVISSIGLLIAAYHYYGSMLKSGILNCSATGVSCSTTYVTQFGFISIPLMSFSVLLFNLVILLAITRLSKNRE